MSDEQRIHKTELNEFFDSIRDLGATFDAYGPQKSTNIVWGR